MLAKLRTFALLGIDARPVEVEVDSAPGMPKVILVGLPEMAVRESVHRVERALANLGYQRPTGRVIISLAPADLRKEGGAFDLPIALGILVATGQLRPEQVKDAASVGELALDAAVRPVPGCLSMAMAARDLGVKRMIVPAANAREAAVVTELEVYGVTSLSEAVGILSGSSPLPATGPKATSPTCAARSPPSGRSSSPRPAGTTCSCSGRPAPARRCSPAACRGFCRR
jgi:magnesium chelatase family protein